MPTDSRNTLRNSILLTLGIYGGVEWLIFHMVARYYHFSRTFYGAFILIQVVFHLAIYVFLLITRNFFYLVDTRKPLKRVNLANKVTLLRISMLPSLLFLVIAIKDHEVGPILLPAITVAFITDLVDGRISRFFHEVTFIGKILDSVSDYSVLLVIGVAYFIYSLIPLWLLIAILVRLLFQAIGMLALLIKNKSVEPKPTIFGKITVASIMVLFALEPCKLLTFMDIKAYIAIIEVIVCGIVCISIFDKAWYFINHRTNLTDF